MNDIQDANRDIFRRVRLLRSVELHSDPLIGTSRGIFSDGERFLAEIHYCVGGTNIRFILGYSNDVCLVLSNEGMHS